MAAWLACTTWLAKGVGQGQLQGCCCSSTSCPDQMLQERTSPYSSTEMTPASSFRRAASAAASATATAAASSPTSPASDPVATL